MLIGIGKLSEYLFDQKANILYSTYHLNKITYKDSTFEILPTDIHVNDAKNALIYLFLVFSRHFVNIKNLV